MSRAGRRLSPEEAEQWARVAKTVTPLRPDVPPLRDEEDHPQEREGARSGKRDGQRSRLTPRAPPPPTQRSGGPPPLLSRSKGGEDLHGLDASWERRLARGLVQPDLTLDLHGASLEAAHARLLHGLAQARAMGARLVLLITGKARPVEPGERGRQRGVIRATVIDWLAASEHARAIAAIRGAHRRHGGPGALYIVLKRRRS